MTPHIPPPLAWRQTARCGNARAGVITMARGTIRTPAFIPVGTIRTAHAIARRLRFYSYGDAMLLPHRT